MSTTELFATIPEGTPGVSGSFTVQNVGGGSLQVTVGAFGDLQDSLSVQGNVLTVSLTAKTSGLGPGTYQLGTVTISSPNADNGPKTVSVYVVVLASQSSSAYGSYGVPLPTYPVYYPPSSPSSGGSESTGSGSSSGSGANVSQTYYYIDYRYPDTDFNYATGDYDTPQGAINDFNQVLQDQQLAIQYDLDNDITPDPNGIISEFRLHQVSVLDDGEQTDQVVQDQQVSARTTSVG